jgi:hypothetical protein
VAGFPRPHLFPRWHELIAGRPELIEGNEVMPVPAGTATPRCDAAPVSDVIVYRGAEPVRPGSVIVLVKPMDAIGQYALSLRSRETKRSQREHGAGMTSLLPRRCGARVLLGV